MRDDRIRKVNLHSTTVWQTGEGWPQFALRYVLFLVNLMQYLADGVVFSTTETSRIEEVACMIDDRSVTLIDTPGFDDTVLSEHEVLTILTDWLETAFVSGTRLSGIIYLHDITNVRMTSSSIRTLTLFRKLCGDESLSNVLLVSNRWEVCDRSLAAQRQEQLVSDGSFWATLLACGARAHRYEHLSGPLVAYLRRPFLTMKIRYRNTRAEAVALVKILLKKPPVALKIQKELVEEGKPLAETNAGAFVHREIVRLKEYHHEELAALREEIARAQRSGNVSHHTEYLPY